MPSQRKKQKSQSSPPKQSPVPPGQGNYVQRDDNIIAVIGFILAFVFPLAGLVCSIIGLKTSKRAADKNRGFAVAGIILSTLFTLLTIAYILVIFLVILPSTYGAVRDLDRRTDLSAIQSGLYQYQSSNNGQLPQNKVDLERSLSLVGSLIFFKDIENGVGNDAYVVYIAERTDTVPSSTDKIAGVNTVHIFIGAQCIDYSFTGLEGNYINSYGSKVIEEGFTTDSYAIVTTFEVNNEVICEDNYY